MLKRSASETRKDLLRAYSGIPCTSMKIILFGGLRPFNLKAALRE